jgi:predicted short-subunit dehydrogenase-like oxidoreductase (DUF2520 family)
VTDQLVIIGPGRMGLALGAALYRADVVEHVTYHGRSLDPPPHPLFDSPDLDTAEPAPASYRIGPLPPPAGTNILILAVTDSALAEVAWETAQMGPAPPGCIALHLSGVLSNDVLAPLHGAGYATGSLHPLMTIADPWQSYDRLFGASYAVAGEPAALRTAQRLVDALDGRALIIPPALRPLYHAAAVSASNHLVALFAHAVRILEGAGVSADEAPAALLPLVRATLDNIEQLGIASALTGPIARGDADTVRLHVARLSREDRALYCALGLETLHIARAAGLDEERALAIESLLAIR